MNRLNLLFFALLISFIHNYYSEFNIIFLESFLFLFVAEYLKVKFYNIFIRKSTNQDKQDNQDDDNSSVSDIEEDKETKQESEDKEEAESTDCEVKKENSEETPEKSKSESKSESESDSGTEGSSDEPVDVAGVDVSQMEILRLLNNYESLGDSGLMELKKKMLELDKLVEFYKNDNKKTKKE